MTINEIFTKLIHHMIKGLMVHDQLTDYYLFLDLEGYRLEQECKYENESTNYRELYKHFVTNHNMLINVGQIENPNIIPSSWYKYTRFDVDISTKKKGIENAFEEWKKWETASLKLYSEMYKELMNLNEVSSALYLKDLIEDVTEELREINSSILKLKAVDYDMTYIYEEQDRLINELY